MAQKQRRKEKIPLWLDCDPGHDDAFAILLSAYHPSLHLLGISTVYGNAPLERTTNNALSILEAIGRADVPVIAGANKPFCRDAHYAPEIHGASGLDGTELLPLPGRGASAGNAVLEIYNSLIGCPQNTAWLVTTGSLTNAALLFAMFPNIADHIRGLSIMGGAIGSDFTDANLGKPFKDALDRLQARVGNHTPYAEFNIWCDPESAHSIFSNPALSSKTTLIPLDLTHRVLATQPVQRMVLQRGETDTPPEGLSPHRLRRMFFELLVFFAQTYSEVFGLTAGPPLHDPLAVAVLLADLDDECGKVKFDDRGGERFGIHVQLVGPELGQTITKETAEGVRIPRGVDADAFWQILKDCLDEATEHVAGLNISEEAKTGSSEQYNYLCQYS